MFRTGISIYLAIMTLAGPWLCCCSAAHLANAKPAAPAAATGTDADDEVSPCCRHRHASRPERAPGERPHRGGPVGPGCPCEKDPNRTAPALDTESARQLRPAPEAPNPSDALPPLPTLLTASADGVAPVPRERQALPFLTADHLLRVLHLLRC
jgi:hypothetical protein